MLGNILQASLMYRLECELVVGWQVSPHHTLERWAGSPFATLRIEAAHESHVWPDLPPAFELRFDLRETVGLAGSMAVMERAFIEARSHFDKYQPEFVL